MQIMSAIVTVLSPPWAFLSAVLGLLASAVAAHPIAAAVGGLYAAGWVWLLRHIIKAPTEPAPPSA